MYTSSLAVAGLVFDDFQGPEEEPIQAPLLPAISCSTGSCPVLQENQTGREGNISAKSLAPTFCRFGLTFVFKFGPAGDAILQRSIFAFADCPDNGMKIEITLDSAAWVNLLPMISVSFDKNHHQAPESDNQ
ncbi:MAG: hypothetical protein ABR523_05115 [Desulfurivibrionaceae bacterium]